jgi:hypothetical protein
MTSNTAAADPNSAAFAPWGASPQAPESPGIAVERFGNATLQQVADSVDLSLFA